MIKKFTVATQGLIMLMKHPSVYLQLGLMICAFSVANLLKFTQFEWVVLILCSGLVIVAEMFNTCIEKLCDYHTTEIDERIKVIKDMSAGAVLFSAIVALTLGIMMVLNHIGG